jgi:hypothetical protein
MHALDEMVVTAMKAEYDCFYVRYADDLLFLTHSAEDGRAIRARLGRFLNDELRLSLSTKEHKCFTKHLNQGISVLGWTVTRLAEQQVLPVVTQWMPHRHLLSLRVYSRKGRPVTQGEESPIASAPEHVEVDTAE